MPPITAYHVSSEPNLDVIRPHVCDSRYYDGLLFGAEVAAFTTTTRNGEFPTRSHYPRETRPRTNVYRYTKAFDPNHYDKFQMANGNGQVHYLLLSRRIARERWIASVLRRLLPETENQEAWDTHFPNGVPNDYDTGELRVFVNVFFFHAVRVTRSDDFVTRSNSQSAVRDEINRPNEWLMQLIEAAMARDEAQDSDHDDDDDELAQLFGAQLGL